MFTQSNIEQYNVKDVYNQIASHFDATRYSHWRIVHKYILELEPHIKMLDMGCGNGKNLGIRNDLDQYAIDNCENFIKIVNQNYPKVNTSISDVTATSYDNNFFDSIISIAVIHHLATKSRRLDMLTEIIRILKVSGTCMITAWSTEQENKKKFLKYIKLCSQSDQSDQSDQSNYLIPWTNINKIVSYRFYHLFEKMELEKLLSNFSNIKLITSAYEKDNWIVIIQKIS